MATILIIAVAVFFAGMGLVALARPEQVLAFFGTPSLSRDGRNEVRAVYGGFGLAVVSLLLVALEQPALRPGVLLTVALALVGMAAGRLISALIDGLPGFYPCLFFAVELALAAALLVAGHAA